MREEIEDMAPSSTQGGPGCREGTLTGYECAVQRVIQAMKVHLGEPFSLESMAKVAYASPYHFNRIFRRVTGIPPCQYLWALRLQAATGRLAGTEDSVLNVCYDVGYNSLGTFTRRFTELFGVPPAKFRALARSSKPSQATLREALQQSPERTAEAWAAARRGQIEGWIAYPPEFAGPSAIALFAGSIPQGRPLACSFMAGPGLFRIGDVPDGTFHIFALGLPNDQSLWATQDMLRAGGNRISVKHGRTAGPVSLALRPPKSTDPPILLALPILLRQQASKGAFWPGRHAGPPASPFDSPCSSPRLPSEATAADTR